jgi:hypothetical protein
MDTHEAALLAFWRGDDGAGELARTAASVNQMFGARFVWTPRKQLRALSIESAHECRVRIAGNANLS